MSFLYRRNWRDDNRYGQSLQFREKNRIRYKLNFYTGILKQTCARAKKVLKLFLDDTSQIYNLKLQIVKYLKSKIIIRLFKFHLSVQNFLELMIINMVVKERNFLIQFTKFRKNSMKCKYWLPKLKSVTVPEIKEET